MGHSRSCARIVDVSRRAGLADSTRYLAVISRERNGGRELEMVICTATET